MKTDLRKIIGGKKGKTNEAAKRKSHSSLHDHARSIKLVVNESLSPILPIPLCHKKVEDKRLEGGKYEN